MRATRYAWGLTDCQEALDGQDAFEHVRDAVTITERGLGEAKIREHASRQLHEIELKASEVWMDSAIGYNVGRDMMALAPDSISELFGESQALADVVDETVTAALDGRKIAYVAHCRGGGVGKVPLIGLKNCPRRKGCVVGRKKTWRERVGQKCYQQTQGHV